MTDDNDSSDENSVYRPCSPYAASKAASNHLIRSYVQTYGLPLLTINGSKIFGAYQYPEALIPQVIRNAVLGKVLSVSRRGENVRDWLFIDDLCRAIDRVLEAGRSGEVYNVGGGNEMKNEAVVNSLCGSLVEASEDFPFSRQSCLAEFSDNPPGRNLRYAMDCTKIGEELGWAPQDSFATGLAKTVAWYLEHQNWCRKVMESRQLIF